MMNANTLLEEIEALGASLSFTDNRLKVQGSALLDDEMRARIFAMRPALVKVLRSREVAPPMPASLVGIEGIEYSHERGEWIRRINGAVWRVPLAKSPTVVKELAEVRPDLEMSSQDLVGHSGTETGDSTGYREFDAGAAYDSETAAFYAAKEYRAGRINREQFDTLLQYAIEAMPSLATPKVSAPLACSLESQKAAGGAQ